MGMLRLYLALCVVADHSNIFLPWASHNGIEAVQIFFLISGFYMAHISSKYASATEFYFSRFLRIYIPYYFVLLLVILTNLTSGVVFNFWGELIPFMSQLDSNGFQGFFIASISNLSLFFQDWVMFLKHNVGEGLYITKELNRNTPLYEYLLIPQAWTIGIELTFYIFVPLLNQQKNKLLLIIILTSLALRIFTYEYLGFNNDPWNYRFFPFELALFILGMLSNRLYVFLKKTKFNLPTAETASDYSVGICLLLLFFYIMKKGTIFVTYFIDVNYSELISYLVWALCLPIIFSIFEKIRFDRYIGELSYPIYLLHLLIIIYVRAIMIGWGMTPKYFGLFSSLFTVALAILVCKFIINPLDNKRYKLASAAANKLKHRTIKKTLQFR